MKINEKIKKYSFSKKGIKEGIIAVAVLGVWIAVSVVIVFIGNSDNNKTEINQEDREPTDATLQDATPQDVTPQDATPQDATPGDASNEFDPLILVNSDNFLPENYEVPETELDSGITVNSHCYEALQEMMDDCRAAGCSPFICSGYRSHETQVVLFERDVRRYKNLGYSEEEAYEKATRMVAIPGTSEHELGLAVDIVDSAYQVLISEQENTKTQKWLMQNCYRYGFILRYPEDKEDITGKGYEPWHYRYVGKEAAKYIYEHNLCLEEYIELIN